MVLLLKVEGFGKKGDPIVKRGREVIFIKDRKDLEAGQWVLLDITDYWFTSRGRKIWFAKTIAKINKAILRKETTYSCGHTYTEEELLPLESIEGEVRHYTIKGDTLVIVKKYSSYDICPKCKIKQSNNSFFRSSFSIRKPESYEYPRIEGRVLYEAPIPEIASKFVRAELEELAKGSPSALGEAAVVSDWGVKFLQEPPKITKEYTEICLTVQRRDGTRIWNSYGQEYIISNNLKAYYVPPLVSSYLQSILDTVERGVITESNNYTLGIIKKHNTYEVVQMGKKEYSSFRISRIQGGTLVVTTLNNNLKVTSTMRIPLPNSTQTPDVAFVIKRSIEIEWGKAVTKEFLYVGRVQKLDDYALVLGKVYELHEGQEGQGYAWRPLFRDVYLQIGDKEWYFTTTEEVRS